MVISYISDTLHNTTEKMTWDKLSQVNLASDVPCLLSLTEQDEPVYCEKIVRVIPKKRVVYFGTWNEQPVVVKLFYDTRNAKRHAESEQSGIESLLSSGVPTPRILFRGDIFKKRAYVLVFEQITDAYNLDSLWQQKTSPEELMPVLQAVTVELATQHVLGILQHDLHFKNFLLKGNQIYTLDGGSIENFHELLSKKTSLEHLALFFSQLGVGTEYVQETLFHIYAKSRGWLIKPADTQFLSDAVIKWNEHRKKNYQQKIQRNCSAFVKIKKTMSVAICDRDYFSPTMQKLMANPESAFIHPQLEILKAGRSSTVIKSMIDDKVCVIKRFNIKNPWHWMRRTLRKTRAAESWVLANTLRLFGVATPKPITFIEKRFIGLRSKSWLVMEYIKGPNLAEYFANYQPEDAHYEKIAARVVALLKNVTKLKMSHGDLKATNIIIENDQPVLLDLDGMKQYKTQSKANRVYKTEIKRFMKNWKNQPAVKALFEKLL